MDDLSKWVMFNSYVEEPEGNDLERSPGIEIQTWRPLGVENLRD